MINPELEFIFEGVNQDLSAESLSGDWVVPYESSYLKGHFPEQPLLPAIAILDASLEFLKTAVRPLDAHSELSEVISAKFMHPVQPGDRIKIQASQISGTNWRLKWDRDGESVADVTLRLRQPREILN